MQPTEIKIAYLGGGSRYWARDLFTELALSPRLAGRIDLYDVDLAAARRNVAIAEAIFDRPEAQSRFAVRAVPTLPAALREADFVLLSIEPGPIELRFADLEIPARHGVFQPVGDTTGPGGLLRALRAVPVFADFAAQIAEHCPRAWVINFTNPLTLCTAALAATAPQLRVFGCCHEVFHTQARLAELVARQFGAPPPDRREIDVDLGGLNHFTWITAARWKGQELLSLLRDELVAPGYFRSRTRAACGRKQEGRWFESDGLVSCDLFRRFGALGAAGDRHLAEFVPWYAGSEAELHRWGVVATPYAWRRHRARERDRSPQVFAGRPLRAGDEECVRMIAALVGHEPIDTNVNLPNAGQMPGLPAGHVVETNARFRHGAVTPIVAPELPAGVQALVRRAADVQALTLRAALTRDIDLAFQALLADPLVRLPTDRAWKMFSEMLAYVRGALAGWRLPAT
jgi:alpha-galactosidase/6-phospho-beta-glucosidase family protein